MGFEEGLAEVESVGFDEGLAGGESVGIVYPNHSLHLSLTLITSMRVSEGKSE